MLQLFGKQQFFNDDGTVLSGGKVYFYEPGTTTLKTTYEDRDGNTANSNPVILDSRGEAKIFGTGLYDIKVTDSSDVEVYTLDDIGPLGANMISTLADLKAADPDLEHAFVLGRTANGDGYEGSFTWCVGDYSSLVTADTQNGTYVPSNSNPTGSSGVWKRDIDTPQYADQYGAAGDGTTDDTTAVQKNLDVYSRANTKLHNDYLITGITLNDNDSVYGNGLYLTKFLYEGTDQAFTTVDDAGYAKTFAQELKDVQIEQTGTLHTGSGVRYVDVGYDWVTKSYIYGFNYGIELRGSVGTHISDTRIQGCATAIHASGAVTLESTTITTINNCYLTVATNAITHTGNVKGFHVQDTTIESNTNVYGGGAPQNMVFRNCWFEDNDYFDLDDALVPVLETCYWAGNQDITGGFAPKFQNMHITGADNFPVFKTTGAVCDVTAVGSTYDYTGQHGMTLTYPIVGSASSPFERYAPQQTSTSQAIGELAGTVFGYSQPTTNRVGNPVSQTAYHASGYWPYGGATVTTGQADMFGGTGSTKLEIGGGSGYHQSSTFVVQADKWYSYQVAFSMVSGDEEIGLWVEGQGASTLDKRMRWEIPDTNVRVLHVLFRGDTGITGVRVGIYIPQSGVIIHRVGLFLEAQLKPFIPEGRAVTLPFEMKMNNVECRSSAAPVAGTWAVGDVVYNTAPAAGGTMGWVCTSAGTPGTWKTFGNIAP